MSQTITWTNDDIFIYCLRSKRYWNLNKNTKNIFQKTIYNSLRPSDTYMLGNLTIIISDNGLSPGRRQAIIWTNAGILLIGHLGTNFSEILIKIITFSFKKMCLNECSLRNSSHFAWPQCVKKCLQNGGHYV